MTNLPDDISLLQESEERRRIAEQQMFLFEEKIERLQRSKSWRYTAWIRILEARLRQKTSFRFRNMFRRARDPYQLYVAKNTLTHEEYGRSVKRAEQLMWKPFISVIIPLENPTEEMLTKTLQSVLKQTYSLLTITIINRHPRDSSVTKWLAPFYVSGGHRLTYLEIPDEKSLPEAKNLGVTDATGEYIFFLEAGDTIEPDTFERMATEMNRKKEKPDLVYIDHDEMDETGKRTNPSFKPNWSPEFLLSHDYIRHGLLFHRHTIPDVMSVSQSQYDFLLRLSEISDKIRHVRFVGYHCAKPDTDTVTEESIEILRSALARRGIRATPKKVSGKYLSLAFDTSLLTDPVTIIIPTKDRADLLRTCIESIRAKTTYPHYEILVIDNGSTEEETKKLFKELNVRVLTLDKSPFNFAWLNNRAVETVETPLVLFLNNDTEVIDPDWLTHMVGTMTLDPKIGAVGAKLLYPNGTVQHCGVRATITGANNAHVQMRREDPGNEGSNLVLANWSGVTAACMLTRTSLFREMGGFDEIRFGVSFNDVDYCLRILEKGGRIVCNPEAVLLHHESLSRGLVDPSVIPASKNLRRRWSYLTDDLYWQRPLD